ncbi:MAG: hypothetical protein WBP64_01530 [Nitrososphaeraceae archaeon]
MAEVIDRGQLKKYEPATPFVKRQGDGPPMDQLLIDNWPEPGVHNGDS